MESDLLPLTLIRITLTRYKLKSHLKNKYFSTHICSSEKNLRAISVSVFIEEKNLLLAVFLNQKVRVPTSLWFLCILYG
jgi:hypothetical protein